MMFSYLTPDISGVDKHYSRTSLSKSMHSLNLVFSTVLDYIYFRLYLFEPRRYHTGPKGIPNPTKRQMEAREISWSVSGDIKWLHMGNWIRSREKEGSMFTVGHNDLKGLFHLEQF